MPSLKDRMAAFQEASSPEAFEKQHQKKSPAADIKTTKAKKFVGQTTFNPVTPVKTKTTTPAKKKVGKLTPEKHSPATSFGKDKPATPPAKRTPGKITPGKLSPANSFGKPNTVTPPKSTPATGRVVENKPSPVKGGPKDWDYLYELSVHFDNLKAQEAQEKKTQANSPSQSANRKDEESEPGVKKDIKSALEGVFGGSYTAKADWLNNQWISDHLVEDKKFKKLMFRLGDPKLFGRFDKTDEKNRDAVIDKFVNTLIGHPQAKEITGLDLSNCLLPDEFLEDLSAKVLKNPKQGLPKLQVLNLETNLLQGPGLEAIAKVIRNEDAWKYLQVLMLENQKKPHTSDAEEALADAIVFSPSIAVCSFRVRGGLQRQQINNTVAANVDVLRQARREHAAKAGTLKERKRNEIEQYFDKIAANDSSITAVDLVGDAKFLALKSDEKTKAGAAFANNTNVKSVKMVKLQLDDKFANALGEALEKNNTIEKLLLDSNVFSGDGIKLIFAGMGKNSSVVELQVRHQSKTMASSDEDALPDLLEPNNTIIKLGVDSRNQLVTMKLDRKTNENREHQRKLRAQAKKAAS
jgi:hypothetical protein